MEEAIRSDDWVQGFGNNTNPRLNKINELYNLFQDIFEKFSNFTRILSESNINNKVFEDRQLSTIRDDLVHFCIELDKMSAKSDYCESCASIKKIKTVSFKDRCDNLYTINQCKKCFELEWNISWEIYIAGLMILKQERWRSLQSEEIGKTRCCYCPNFAVIYKNGLSLCQDCLNDDLDFIQIKDKKELSKDDCE